MKYPDAGINPAKSGLTARAGLYFNAGLHDKGDGFNLQDLDPYLLFDAETSMLGNLENPTLDLDPATPDTLDVITATRAGIATYTAADGQIVTADENTVRVDWSLGYPAMLIEPSATNLVPYSEDSGAWSKTDVTVTPNTTAAPDGNQTANTAVATGSSPQVTSTGNYATSGLEYTISVFAKAETDAIIQLDVSNAVFGAVNATFNARTGELTDGDETKVSIEYLNDGWKRFSFTATCLTTGTSSFLIRLQNTEPVHLWGYQFEQGSVATSYIPTSGGSVSERTRNADNLVIDGTDFSDFYNATEGTFYIEATERTQEDRAGFIAGQGTNQFFLYHNGSADIYSYDGGAAINLINRPVNQLFRAAVTYTPTTKTISMNGAVSTVGVHNGNWAAANILNIGWANSQYIQLNGHIKRLIYWPTHSDNL